MTADVCLVLEGTYPFVAGGVSTWVHTLITDLPELEFHALHLSPGPGSYPDGCRYDLPPNVVAVDEVYLQTGGDDLLHRHRAGKEHDDILDRFRAFLAEIRHGHGTAFDRFFRAANDMQSARTLRQILLQSEKAWQVLLDTYREEAAKDSFLHFVWTWRFALLPLLNVLATPLPPARCYHTICTGYAGLLAAGARARTGRPMILTEHGIYTKERRIDIRNAAWIPDEGTYGSLVPRNTPYFRAFWMRQFDAMSRTCYEAADEILTLYEGNRTLQVEGGADRSKVDIVPNGIDVQRFGTVHQHAEAHDPDVFTIGFIGRVCAIKDLRTLLQAMRLAVDEMAHIRLRILGPIDDEEYMEECCRLTRALRLQDHVLFEGLVDIRRVLPTLDLCVLSSISEAQPLTLLEVAAMGIPSVATDVGACSELLGGRTPDDKALGDGGLVVPMASPGAMARAFLRLARDDELRRAMGDAMKTRVQRFYDVRDMVARYRAIYARHLGAEAA